VALKEGRRFLRAQASNETLHDHEVSEKRLLGFWIVASESRIELLGIDAAPPL